MSQFLIAGEISVDFTVTGGEKNKLRLGGIAHAARGLWALGVQYDVAAILPEYLDQSAQEYLSRFGCDHFHISGRVTRAPNVTVIFDVREIGHQGYETLLREEKVTEFYGAPTGAYSDAVIFPGSFDLAELCAGLPSDCRLHIDAAYDLDPTSLKGIVQPVDTIFLSTSSPLFLSLTDQTIFGVRDAFSEVASRAIVLKHNRGGSELLVLSDGRVHSLPAQLGTTVNSVGVGDVFAAIFSSLGAASLEDAGWRATYAAAAYSQTTYPDQLREYVQRDLRLTTAAMGSLGGVFLPWARRPLLPIYLAAPDFSCGPREAIDRALAALDYHNFCVRRPVIENGELPPNSDLQTLRRTFRADSDLINACRMLFAVPTRRDPGTLVEIGMAIARGIPVVTYDPERDAGNTMVIAGSACYSQDLDECLNSTFSILSKTAP